MGLKRLSATCQFSNFLDDALRDRFVAGLRDINLQRELLKKIKLTFNEAIDTAMRFEITTANSNKIQFENKDGSSIYKISSSKQNSEKEYIIPNKKNYYRKCYRCGDPSHLANTCRFRSYACSLCKKVGHLQKVCRARFLSANVAEESESTNKEKEFF